MAYQKQHKLDNRRIFKKIRIDEDGEEVFEITGMKLTEKSYARPIILTGKQANELFLNNWRKNGWKEGDEW